MPSIIEISPLSEEISHHAECVLTDEQRTDGRTADQKTQASHRLLLAKNLEHLQWYSVRTQGFKAGYQNVPLDVRRAYNIALRCMCWKVDVSHHMTEHSARPSVTRLLSVVTASHCIAANHHLTQQPSHSCCKFASRAPPHYSFVDRSSRPTRTIR